MCRAHAWASLADTAGSALPVNTVIGPIAWDRKGDRTTADYVMYVWHNGTYTELS